MSGKLKTLLPQTQVMMLTVYEDTENIFNALAAGANGYLLKRTPTKELIEAIREVNRGGSPMTTHIARLVVQSFQKPLPARAAAGGTAAGNFPNCPSANNRCSTCWRRA